MKFITLGRKDKKGVTYKTVVDDDDFEKFACMKFHILRSRSKTTSKLRKYVVHRDNQTNKNIYIHRLITNCPDGKVVDHINHNTLDNRKCNLRICSDADNFKNQVIRSVTKTSIFKGVSRSKANNKFRASIFLNYKRTHIGYFLTEEEAAHAYDMKAIELHGEFKCNNEDLLNFDISTYKNLANKIEVAKVENSQYDKKKNCTSSFKGVFWKNQNCKWNTRIIIPSGYLHLGFYDTEEEAAYAYNVAALKYFSLSPKLNDIAEKFQHVEKYVLECIDKRNKIEQGLQVKKSKYKGVTFQSHMVKNGKPWRAKKTINGVRTHLGYFATEEEASLKYLSQN